MGDLPPENVTTNISTICINRVELLFWPYDILTDGMADVFLVVNN